MSGKQFGLMVACVFIVLAFVVVFSEPREDSQVLVEHNTYVGQWYDWPSPPGVPVVGMYRTASGFEVYAAFVSDDQGNGYEWWGLGRNPVPVSDPPEKWCRRPEFGKEIDRE